MKVLYPCDLILEMSTLEVRICPGLNVNVGLRFSIKEPNLELTRHIGRIGLTSEEQNILDWLTPSDYRPRHNELVKQSLPGSCQWFLECDEYHHWLKSTQKTILCQGAAAAGKTFLTSIIIEDLFCRFGGEPANAICWLYCDFRLEDTQQLEDLLLSLLKQLAQGLQNLPRAFLDICRSHIEGGTRLSIDGISSAIESLKTFYARAFIIIDAIDECPKIHLWKLIAQLLAVQAKTETSLFVTSRPNTDIEQAFGIISKVEFRSGHSDMESFLGGSINKLPAFAAEDDSFPNDFVKTITRAADGMYVNQNSSARRVC